VKAFSVEQRRALMRSAGREGLSGKAPDGRTIQELARTLTSAASAGLCRQNCCGEKGDDERTWLAPLVARAESGRSPADEALEVLAAKGPRALAEHVRCA